jgi:hypothetical protein
MESVFPRSAHRHLADADPAEGALFVLGEIGPGLSRLVCVRAQQCPQQHLQPRHRALDLHPQVAGAGCLHGEGPRHQMRRALPETGLPVALRKTGWRALGFA